MKAHPLLPFLLLANACFQADEHIDTVFDPCETLVLAPIEATTSQRESILAASAMWNELAASRLTVDDDGVSPKLPIRFEDAAPPFHGFYDDEAGLVYINTDLEVPRERAITLAHEIGHAFGLLHVEQRERLSVMNRGNRAQAPTAGDRDALAALWGDCAARPAPPQPDSDRQ